MTAGCPDKFEPELTSAGTGGPGGPDPSGASGAGESTTSGATGEDTIVEPTGAGSHECGTLLANNDANCVCLPGYERCEPGTLNTDCCVSDDTGGGTCPDPNSGYDQGQCFCNPGYQWCHPDDPEDLSCCEDPQPTTDGTGGDACPGAVEPPAFCDENTELAFCTHPASCGPQGSTQFYCEGGVWVEDTTLDQACQLDGYDFAYGCVDDGVDVYIECGEGSGAACSGSEPSCLDANTWVGCKWGKSTEADCFALCTEIGDEQGATYDFGSCEVQDDQPACVCCDQGEPGCPI